MHNVILFRMVFFYDLINWCVFFRSSCPFEFLFDVASRIQLITKNEDYSENYWSHLLFDSYTSLSLKIRRHILSTRSGTSASSQRPVINFVTSFCFFIIACFTIISRTYWLNVMIKQRRLSHLNVFILVDILESREVKYVLAIAKIRFVKQLIELMFVDLF